MKSITVHVLMWGRRRTLRGDR